MNNEDNKMMELMTKYEFNIESWGMYCDMVYRYLCIKTTNRKISQYRNPWHFEQYSKIAMFRIGYQLLHNKQYYDYRPSVEKLIENSFVCENQDEIIIQVENVKCLERLLDIDAIYKNLHIKIIILDSSIVLLSENKKTLSKYLLALLCDLIDYGEKIDIIFNEEFKSICEKELNRTIEYKEDDIKKNRYVDKKFINEIQKCGYQIKEGEVLLQPYRLDVVMMSDVISDIWNLKTIEERVLQIKSRKEKSFFAKMAAAQEILNIREMSFHNIVLRSSWEINEIEDTLIEWEVLHRNKKFPHHSYAFVIDKNEYYTQELILWKSGKCGNINEFGNHISQSINMICGELLVWDKSGTILYGKQNSETKALIWLVEHKDDKLKKFGIDCLVIGKIWL